MEPERYRELVGELKDRVFSYAARLLRDREEARDVTQEAFVRLWQHRESVDDAASVRSWVFKTAHNLCIDLIRARRHQTTWLNDDLSDTFPHTSEPGPERSARSGELRTAVSRALGRLPARDREILLLREVHGMSYEELALVINAPLGTLKAVLHRARLRLRRELRAVGVEP